MQVAAGTSILNGIAIGPLRVCRKARSCQVSQVSALTPREEWARFQAAAAKAKEQLAELYDKAVEDRKSVV